MQALKCSACIFSAGVMLLSLFSLHLAVIPGALFTFVDPEDGSLSMKISC
jgi:hypothetical protein